VGLNIGFFVATPNATLTSLYVN